MDWREAKLGGLVGPGWEPLVDELHRRVTELCPEIVVAQVKEKFGQLRYYYDLPESAYEQEIDDIGAFGTITVADRIEELVGQAELVTGWICEVCGKPGHTEAWGHGWLLTLCPEHGERRRSEGTPGWKMGEEVRSGETEA